MADFLVGYAQSQPDKMAVIDDRPDGKIRTLTWKQLNEESNRLANVLIDAGLTEAGQKVIWCGPNSVGVVVMTNAARKLGVTAVPLNYRLSDDEAAYVTDHCDATVVYVDADYASMFQRIADRIPKIRQILVYDGAAPEKMQSCDALMAQASPLEPEIPVDRDPGAVMIYTSGTTGKPKGALRTSRTSPEQGFALAMLLGAISDDIYLTTGPLYHSGPGGFMYSALAFGQTIVTQHKFDPQDWLRLVDKYKASTTFSAPTPIRMICNLPADVKTKFDVSSMRCMVANAAPWSMTLKKMYLDYFPAISLYEIYGSTELGVNCVLLPEDQLRKPGSCGKPSPLVEVKLFDDQGNEVTGFGPQYPGELYVKSPSVFADYYKQHDKYVADQKHGYQTVGDIAYRDEEGYIYICDRKKDMIISAGMNIYPAEIEGVLENHDEIYEAAVFGIPNEEWGEMVHAVIVRRPGSTLTEADVDVYARVHLASYKVPRSVTWSDELPKTGSGKILKRDLRAPYWAGRASQV